MQKIDKMEMLVPDLSPDEWTVLCSVHVGVKGNLKVLWREKKNGVRTQTCCLSIWTTDAGSYRLPTLWLQVLSIYANRHFMKGSILLQHTHDACHVNVHRNVHQYGESTSHAFTTAAFRVFFHETSVEEPCEGSHVRQTSALKRSPCTFQSKWEQMDWRWRLRAGGWVVLVLRVGEGSGTQCREKLLILLFYDVLWRSMLQSAPKRLAMCD